LVKVPSGTCTWSEEVVVSGKAITIKGAGIDSTIIKTNCCYAAFEISGEGGTINDLIRVTGFTFDGQNFGNAIEILDGNIFKFRIDHNKFLNTGGDGYTIVIGNVGSDPKGHFKGVIDNNTFLNCFGDACIDVSNDDEGAWNRDTTLGTDDATFVEDNTFTWDSCGSRDPSEHIIAANYGARYVFRYNTIDSCSFNDGEHRVATLFDAHGYCAGGEPNRGTVTWEIYNNTVDTDESWVGGWLRGGKGVFFDNTFSGLFTGDVITLTNYRSREDCDWCQDGCCTQYPCTDQINNAYFWGNTYESNPVLPVVMDENLVPTHIQLNKDYFTNSMPGYTPYTYPHPLTNISPPSPPSNPRRVLPGE
jgi:hypothetical protein